MLPDLRLALRHLRRAPGYTATAVLTFALAIGANSAVFSAVKAVLLRPLPVEAPGGLAVVWQTDAAGHGVAELTYRHLREWTEAGTTFTRASLMGSHNWNAILQGRGEPTRIWFNGVSAGFFDTLGVTPLLGRTLRPEDDVPNAPAVAVLNHATWVRRFGADPAVIGTTMTLDGRSVEIVGVMRPGFEVPRGAEFWMAAVPAITGGNPNAIANLDHIGVSYLVGRLRAGLDMNSARRELDALEARLDRDKPGRLKWGERAAVTSLSDHVFGPVRAAMPVLWGAVGVLLLIACSNVSGLMLTRVSRRRHEHAIRLALGASRGAIARLWLAEIVIVSSAGGLLGLAFAHWLTAAIVSLAPDDMPRIGEVSVDAAVAFFTFAAVAIVALVTGALPLRQAGATSLVEAFEGERTTGSRQALRMRSTLLVAQIGLSVVLLVAAGLLVRSFMAVRQTDLGFAPERVLSLKVEPGNPAQPGNTTAGTNPWIQELLTHLRTLPGVEAAGAVQLRPLMFGPIGSGVGVRLEGQPETVQALDANPTLNHQVATPGYFEAMRIPLRAGRLFSDRDTADMPRVAIVGESTAKRLWPGQNPIGKRVFMTGFTRPRSPNLVARTVVGVVSDVRYHAIGEVQFDIYDPALQVDSSADNVVVRTSGDPRGILDGVRAAARRLDAAAIVDEVTTMEAVVGRAEAPWRLTMWMFVLFAALAFGLSAVGLFSLVALEVAHRRREFAIRLALGAPGATIVRNVLWRAAWRVAAGLVLGFGVAFAASRVLRSLLFGVAPDDAATYGLVFAVVLTVVAFAAYLPARRAVQGDPHAILRQG
jgi:putative ABC transport system permease protein